MNREPLEHGRAWHQAGRQVDELVTECQRVAKMLDDIAEEMLVSIGHARFVGRRIDRAIERRAA